MKAKIIQFRRGLKRIHERHFILDVNAKSKEEAKKFVGKSDNKVLWDELIMKYEMGKEYFHVSNCCKCYPSESTTPNSMQIKTCKRWLLQELEEIECRLILALGNAPLELFTGRIGGISSLSGTTEWNEDVGAWICWCVNPSSIFKNPSNKQLFEDGIANFVEKIKILYKTREGN